MKKALERIGYVLDSKANILKIFEDLVIVHFRFLKPEINIISPKYTTSDTFANFGGTFGIFAEITGCSFLGLLNILILVLKIIFCSYGFSSKKSSTIDHAKCRKPKTFLRR